MDCCAGHSENHQSDAKNNNEKKISWISVTIILLIIGLIVFSILK